MLMQTDRISPQHWSRRLDELSAHPCVARALWLALAVLVSLFHLFTNTLGIAHTDLGLDDAGTWGIANRSLLTQLTLPTEFHSQPPLYYLVLHFLLHFGSAAWFLRSLSWLFCWLLLLFVLFAWDELELRSRAGFCLIFLAGGITRYLSTAVRPYGLAALLTLVASVMFLRFVGEPTRRRAVVYGAWTCAMLYTMAFEVAVFLVHAMVIAALVVVSFARDARANAIRKSRTWLLTMAAVGVAYLPYLCLAYHYQYQPNPHDTLKAVLRASTYLATLKELFGVSPEMSVALATLVALGVVGELARRRGRVLYWTALAVGSMVFVWYFIVGRSPIGAQAKYMLPAFLAVCALAALGLGQVRPLTGRGFWPVIVVLAAVLVGSKHPAWSKQMRAGPNRGAFTAFHDELKSFPGQKVFFFDVGWEAQYLEYVTRHDPDVIYASQRGRGWASGGEGAITDAYVTDVIARWHGACTCFFYAVVLPPGPFGRVFVPTLTRLGYQATRPLPPVVGHSVAGYCRK